MLGRSCKLLHSNCGAHDGDEVGYELRTTIGQENVLETVGYDKTMQEGLG